MINLRVRSEYSFGICYGFIGDVVRTISGNAIGLTDRHGTWGHVAFQKSCKQNAKKPIFGVELAVVQAVEREKHPANYMAFLARNNAGLQEIYELTTEATGENNFYYHPRIPYSRLPSISQNIAILSGTNPNFELLKPQKNLYIELAPSSHSRVIAYAKKHKLPLVATSDNYFLLPEHREVYELVAGRNRDARTVPMHVLNEWEWRNLWPGMEEPLQRTYEIAGQCNAEIPTAQMVKYNSKKTLEQLCREAAGKRNINLKDKVYEARLRRELDMIKEKDFADYFFVIHDLLNYAKQHMIVGPARGSSCGSLVCYLLGITEVDPIPFDLLFERFIDVNRKDLPDIDIDFAEDKRDMVFEYAEKKYGKNCVARLGTIMRYKAKSAIDAVATALHIPVIETEDLKGAIIERSGGDARAAFCILDTFEQLDIGRRMLEKYPHLRVAAGLENHAKTTGKHAAGILITQEPISKFCSVNQQTGAVMVDKYDAESINLLKIDALGLRTLSVIQDCLDQIDKKIDWLLQYPLNDSAAFDIINDHRFAGIFQMEGYALQSLCQQMKVTSFEDIAALGALGRPGPITSGGATEYVARKNGKKRIEYLHPLCKECTEVTLGVVIYQEQVMQIGRIVGKLDWEDVSSLRKAMSKSLGKEFFDKYWDKFVVGAKQQGVTEEQAKYVWEHINTMGSWCVSGETEIQNPFPNHVTPKTIKIKELAKNKGYIRKHSEYLPTGGRRIDSEEQKYDIIKKQQVYSQQQDGRIIPCRLVDCWYSGEKETWEVRTESGASIRATKQHGFAKSDGTWPVLGELKVGDEICLMGKPPKGTKHKPFKGTGRGAHNEWHGQSLKLHENIAILKKKFKKCQRCKIESYQETHHIDGDRMHNDISNLLPVCRKCHKKIHKESGVAPVPHAKGKLARVERITFIGNPRTEKVYDIQMPSQSNNFVANGFIVANSFNRSHAVAYGLITYWCMVLKSQHPLEWATSCLRNSSGEEQIIKLLRELDAEGYKYIDFDRKLSKLNWSIGKGNLIVGGLLNVKGVGAKKAADILDRRKRNVPLTPAMERLLDNAVTPFNPDRVFECRVRFKDLLANPTKYNINSKIWKIGDIDAQMEGEFLFLGKLVKKNLRDLNEPIHVQKRNGVVLTGQTLYLICTVEDDTSSIYVATNERKYMEIGKPIIETGQLGDWYLWKGYQRAGFRKVFLSRVRKLTGIDASPYAKPGSET